MDFIARCTKVFAIPLMLFVNFLSVDSANAQGDPIYRLPAGTKITLTIDAELSSKVASVNDTFTSTVAKAISVENVVVLPFGAVIEGRVVKVSSAGYGGKNGLMQVHFESIRFADNRSRMIDGSLVRELMPDSAAAANIFSIFGGTAAGALIGAASKTQSGALIGAGIGAGAGTAAALIKKGKDVRIRTEQEFEIELKSEVTLPAERLLKTV